MCSTYNHCFESIKSDSSCAKHAALRYNCSPVDEPIQGFNAGATSSMTALVTVVAQYSLISDVVC